MKIIRNVCRIIVGLVFIYSGFVKGVDPLGSMYKIIDYFNAFGLEWFSFSALFFSISQSLIEFLIGVGLVFNLHTKLASWGALLFMAFFTPLTLLLAFTDPISDCGCFGDALILTNWETFWKNLILLILTIIIFINRHKFYNNKYIIQQTLLLFAACVGMLGISLYSYYHLPIFDFRPYSIGTNLPESMGVPEGKQPDVYEVILKYKNKKTGEIESFTEANYPWQDTLNWEFESTSERLVKKGYSAPINDIYFEHPEYGNIAQELLEDDNYTFLAISYNINKANSYFQNKANQLANYAKQKGYNFYGLTASSDRDVRNYKSKNKVPYTYLAADETELKTMIRANPGIILIKDGTIINKWAARDLPEINEIKNKDLVAYSLKEQKKQIGYQFICIFSLIFIVLYFMSPARKKRRT